MLRRSCIRHKDNRLRSTTEQLPVPLFSHATFLADFMARRFQEAGISHWIDVNVDAAVEEK